MRCNHEREESNGFGHTVTNQQDTIHPSFLSECTRKKYPSSNIKHVSSKLKQTASKTTTSQHQASKMLDRNPLKAPLAFQWAGYSFPVTLRHLILGDQFNEPLEGVVMFRSWRLEVKRKKVHKSRDSAGMVYF